MSSDLIFSTVSAPSDSAIMDNTVKASWTKLTRQESLQRSSHSVAVIGKHAYVFGGELLPRQPRDGVVHALELAGKGIRVPLYWPLRAE